MIHFPWQHDHQRDITPAMPPHDPPPHYNYEEAARWYEWRRYLELKEQDRLREEAMRAP